MEGGWELQAVSARAPTRARGSRFMGQRWLAMYEGLVDRVEEGFGAGEGPDGGVEGVPGGLGRHLPGETDEDGRRGSGAGGIHEGICLVLTKGMAGDDHVEGRGVEAIAHFFGMGDGDGEAVLFEDHLARVEQDLVCSYEECGAAGRNCGSKWMIHDQNSFSEPENLSV